MQRAWPSLPGQSRFVRKTRVGNGRAAHPRAAQVFEQRLFGGLEVEEIAAALGISTRTATRDWQTARAWLRVAVGRDLDRS